MTAPVETRDKSHLVHEAYVSLLRRAAEYEEKGWELADKFERHAINGALDIKGLREEIERLRAWKESQKAVTPDWQKIGELLKIGLGQSVTENIIPAITELRAKLAEQTEGLRVMTEIAGHRQGEWEKAETRAEAAEAEVAALRERERWIPVEEKLPEDRQLVFAHNGQKYPLAVTYRKDNYYGGFRHGASCLSNVTHWKALSAAPEAK